MRALTWRMVWFLQLSSHMIFYYWVGSESVETSRDVPGSLGSSAGAGLNVVFATSALWHGEGGMSSGMSRNRLGSERIKFTGTSSLDSGYTKEAKSEGHWSSDAILWAKLLLSSWAQLGLLVKNLSLADGSDCGLLTFPPRRVWENQRILACLSPKAIYMQFCPNCSESWGAARG